MSLSEDIKPYIDGNGLVAPNKVPPGTVRGSDNGVLFTSEFIILAKLNFEAPNSDIFKAVMFCIINDRLERAPADTSPETPDDYYGILSFINFVPGFRGSHYWLPLRMWHPVLMYLWLRDNNIPLYFLLTPLVAIIIALSNLFENKENTSNKMLTWCITHGTSHSVLCRIASAIWRYRMRRIYGQLVEIPKRYFEAGHPFITYWKD